MGALAWKLPEPDQVERRQDQRVKVRLLGRFMRSDRKEFDCESIDASPSGIAFSSRRRRSTRRAHRRLSQPDRTRRGPGGADLSRRICDPDERAARQARQVGEPDCVAREPPGARAYPKTDAMSASRRETGIRSCRLPNGREFTATLIDISMSGAALNVDCEPPIGARVSVGATPAEVVRHVNCGIAVEFLTPLPADEFGEDTTL